MLHLVLARSAQFPSVLDNTAPSNSDPSKVSYSAIAPNTLRLPFWASLKPFTPQIFALS